MIAALRFALAVWSASLRGAMEYRASFLAQAGAMLLNNVLWLSFWGVFFARFRDVSGWTLQDTALLYGLVATGFGFAVVLAGGVLDLARLVSQGALDGWLLRPRPVLLQALLSRMRLSGFGDVATGYVVLGFLDGTTPARVAAFTGLAVVAGVVMASFWLLVHASAFWLRRAEAFAQQGTNASITLSVHPPVAFQGRLRVLLHVGVPVAFISWLPTSLLADWDGRTAALLALGASCTVAAALLAWTLGLRRYESGNLTQAVG